MVLGSVVGPTDGDGRDLVAEESQAAFLKLHLLELGLPCWLRWQRICLQVRRPRFDPWVREITGEGNGNPLQYSCLDSMDRGAW